MFVKVKISGNLAIGTVVSYDDINNYWSIASNESQLIGVISKQPIENTEDQSWRAQVIFSGLANALVDRDIPDQGGKFKVLNGKVYVDNSGDSSAGIICPKPETLSSRTEGDLVMVDIRQN